MKKLLFLLALALWIVIVPAPVQAASDNNFVNVVNPIRGRDFWDLNNQEPIDSVLGQIEIVKKYDVNPTWLVRFDALRDSQITNLLLGSPTHEKGLFLEITPTLTDSAGVSYHKTDVWHFAGSLFLTGYSQQDRIKIIDTAFEEFKKVFGVYPKSVGAWWIDSYSLDYMQQKYGVSGALIVSDQYSTDNYQIWGQYWSTPYYPTKRNALSPAQTLDSKIPLVITQWAARDPYHGYSNGVNESTYSVQANDYIDYHNLTTDYFSKLVDVYTKQPLNQFGQIVIGLENTYDWNKYKGEYERQIKVVKDKQQSSQLKIVPMEEFSRWYKVHFPNLSPEHIIVANDLLGSDKKVVWFMNPYYRVGWFYNGEQSALRDIRQYVPGQEELCFAKVCESINFAFFATRVLDDVTYGHKWVTGIGQVDDISVVKLGNNYQLSYISESGKVKVLEFMPRDLVVNGQKSSIDLAIAKGSDSTSGITINSVSNLSKVNQLSNLFNLLKDLVLFCLFIIFALFIPGYLLNRNIFVSLVLGLALITLFTYGVGFFNSSSYLLWGYILVSSLIFVLQKKHQQLYQEIKRVRVSNISLLLIVIVLVGVIFQNLAIFRSGWSYDFGIGYWGATGHDGIWHEALINQLIKSSIPDSPIMSGEKLLNYHYFYDLLIAITSKVTGIGVLDLVYRFYPLLLSVLLGVGTYLLGKKLFNSRVASFIAVYLVYFAGSFGWVIEYMRSGTLGGESVFWANQTISFNFNPPFAVSLILMICLMLIMLYENLSKNKKALISAAIILGVTVEFKAYAGILALGGVGLMALVGAKNKDLTYLKLFLCSLMLSLVVFLPNNSQASGLVVFSPLWFIDSMIDSPDRVGWLQLSQARAVYKTEHNYLKFVAVEFISLAIFIIGNLGIRSLGLLMLLFVRKKTSIIWYFIASVILAGILIPIVIIQKGNPWNTIQFMYYSLYLTALLSGFIIYKLFSRLSVTFNVIAVSAVLMLAVVNSIVSFKDYLGTTPPAALSTKEHQALSFLKSQPEGVVLSYPYQRDVLTKVKEPTPLFAYVSNAYISAYSNKVGFIEDLPQHQILQTDYSKRLVSVDEFFKWTEDSWSKEFLRQNNIKYIYLQKVFKFDLSKLNLDKIYENEEVEILSVSI